MATYMPYNPILKDVPYELRPFSNPYTPRPYNPFTDMQQDTSVQTIFDYNDPYEVNSLADVILNEAALNKKYKAPFGLQDRPGFDLADVAQRIQGALGLFTEGTVRPIAQGFKEGKPLSGFGGALLNTLQNFGETQDVLANAVKGAILEPEGPAKGLLRGLGVTDEGRKNYDYDTKLFGESTAGGIANTVVNIGLEVISDPFNWVTMGAAALGKNAVKVGKETIEEAVQRAARETGQAITKEQGELIARQVTKTLYKNADDVGEAAKLALDNLSRASYRWDAIAAAKNTLFADNLVKQLTSLSGDQLGIDVLKGLQKWGDASSSVQKILAQGTGVTSGVMPVWGGAKLGLSQVGQWFRNTLNLALENYRAADGTIPVTQMRSALNQLEDVFKWKLVSEDAPTDMMGEVARGLRVASIMSDATMVSNIMQKTDLGSVQKALDEYFLEKTKGELDFNGFVDFLKDFQARHPDFGHFYEELEATRDYVRALYERELIRPRMELADQARDLLTDVHQHLARHKALDKYTVKDFAALRALQVKLDNLQLPPDFGERSAVIRMRGELAALVGELDMYMNTQMRELGLRQARVDALESQIYQLRANLIELNPATLTPAQTVQANLLQRYLSELPLGDMAFEEVERAAQLLAAARTREPILATLFPGVYNRTALWDVIDNANEQASKLIDEVQVLKRGAFDPPAELVRQWDIDIKEFKDAAKRLNTLSNDIRKQMPEVPKDATTLTKHREALQEWVRQNPGTDFETIIQTAETLDKAPSGGYRALTQEELDSVTEPMDTLLKTLQRGDIHLSDLHETQLQQLMQDLQLTNTPEELHRLLIRLKNRIDDMIDEYDAPETILRRDKRTAQNTAVPWLAVFEARNPQYAAQLREVMRTLADTAGVTENPQLTEAFQRVHKHLYEERAALKKELFELEMRYTRADQRLVRQNLMQELKKLRQYEAEFLEPRLKLYWSLATDKLTLAEKQALLDAEWAKYNDLIQRGKGSTTGYDDFIDQLETVVAAIDRLDPQTPNAALVDYARDQVIYRLKLANFYGAQYLLNSSTAEQFIQDIRIDTEIGALLQQLTRGDKFDDQAKAVLGRAASHTAYRAFLNRIISSPNLKPIAANIFDTVQTLKQRDFDFLYLNRDYYINKLITDLQGQLNSISLHESLALDKLFGEGETADIWNAYFEDWLKRKGVVLTGKAHDASYDVLKTMFLFEENHFLGSVKFDPARVQVFLDIETTGKNIGSDHLLQIAWRTTDGQAGEILFKPGEGVVPSMDLLSKFTDADDKLGWYNARYVQNPVALSQQDGLQEFLTQMKALNAATGRQVELVGYNLDLFDRPMLLSRMRDKVEGLVYDDLRWFENLSTFDGLAELQALRGGYRVTPAQRRELYEALRIYFEAKAQNPFVLPSAQKFLDSIDGDFALELKTFARSLMDEKDPAYNELVTRMLEVQAEIWDNLRAISRMNDELQNASWYKDPLTGKLFGKDGLPLDASIGIHTTHLMASDVGQFMEFAVRIDKTSTPNVKRFFQGIEKYGKVFTRQDTSDLFYFAKAAARTSDLLKRLDLAGQHYDAYPKIGAELKAFLAKAYVGTTLTPSKMVSLLDLNLVGTADRYAAIRRLYLKVRDFATRRGLDADFKQLEAKLGKDYGQAFETVANRGDFMFRFPTEAMPEQRLYTSRFFDLSESKLYADGRAYSASMLGTVHDLRQMQLDLSILRTRTDLSGATAQLQDSLLQRFREVWEDLVRLTSGLDKADARYLQMAMIDHTDRIALSQLEWISKLDPQAMQEYLWFAFGRITFGLPPDANTRSRVFMRSLYKHMQARTDELKLAGINVHYDPAADRMWLFLDNDETIWRKYYDADLTARKAEHYVDPYAKFYTAHTPYLQDSPVLPQEVQALINKAHQSMADVSFNRVSGSIGDMIFRDNLDDIDKAAPPEIARQFIPAQVFDDALRFDDTILFNHTNLGLVSSRQKIMPYISGNILKNYTNAAQNLVPMLDKRMKATHLFFDTRHQLNGELYEALSDAEIFEMLQNNPQLRLAALVKDKQFGMLVRDMKPHSVAEITQIRGRLEASILPVGAFIQAYKYINEFKGDSRIAKFLNHYIIGPTKAGYLSSLGFVMRNIVDSTLKNIILSGNPVEAGRMVMHTLESGKHYRQYKDILEQVLHHEKNTHRLFSRKILDRLYEEVPDLPLSKEMFQVIHDFVEQGPSAGLSSLQQDLLLEKWRQRRERRGQPELKQDWVDKAMNNPYTKNVLGLNAQLEQIFRLSGYTWGLMNGETVDTAIQQVLRHHFDYSLKSKTAMYAEYVVPFATFSQNNTLFWLEELSRHGWVSGMFRDLMTPIWNFDEWSNRELNLNRSIQYNILAGNMVLPDNVTVKLSPSLMDAIRLLTDPDEARTRIAAYIKLPVEIIQAATDSDSKVNIAKLLATNIPLIGPAIQRLWVSDNKYEMGSVQTTYERTGKLFPALVPSIFGAVQRNYYFAFPGKGVVYMTHDEDKFKEMLAKGGKEIRDFAPLELAIRKYYSARTYAKKIRARRLSLPKQKKAKRFYARKTFARNADPYVAARIISRARGQTNRLPNPNSGFRSVKPALYRRIYTGQGRDRFASRLVPITPKNLAARLRSDWSYIR